MYDTIRFRATGVAPLLMHNGGLADPRNPYTKAKKPITSKGAKKTEDDHEELSRLEFFGGLYHREGIGPYVPAYNLWSGLIGAARHFKLGKKAKAALLIPEDAPLQYEGPRTPNELWEAGTFHLTKELKQQQTRIMRTRPMFPVPWSIEFDALYLSDQLDRTQVIQIAEVLGRLEGLGDWRPMYGRFTVEVLS